MSNMFVNDSGFLFSTDKYDEEKRLSIVLTFRSFEKNISIYDNIADIVYKLNTYYKEVCSDVCPYHYIITTDGICHNIKNSMLSVPNNNCELQEYLNDIKILIISDTLGTINENQENSLIDIISKESNNYALLISDTLYFQKDEQNQIEDILKYHEIVKKAIIKRNTNNSLFSIIEHVINDEVVVNEKIRVIPPLTNELGLEDIAMKHNVPLSIMKNLNPHIDYGNCNDIIFVPNTETLNYKQESIKMYKQIFRKIFKIKSLLEGIKNV